jgi:hypothetical protein
MTRLILIAGAIIALVSAAMPAQATPIGGPIPGLDPFTLTFDENGNGTVCIFGGGCSADAGFIDANGFLAYTLPEAVGLGDVAISGNPSEPCTTTANCSDGLRFTQLQTGAFVMEFMSDPGEGVLADTGFAGDFSTAFVGADEGNTGAFAYGAPQCPANDFSNCYQGLSDAAEVPEPATLGLLGAGLFGLAAAIRRRRRG